MRVKTAETMSCYAKRVLIRCAGSVDGSASIMNRRERDAAKWLQAKRFGELTLPMFSGGVARFKLFADVMRIVRTKLERAL